MDKNFEKFVFKIFNCIFFVFQAEINGEILSDMILQDVLRDTAEELESLEDEENVGSEAVTMHHNPTLENMYQRLEQMEVKCLFDYIEV